MTAWVPVAGMLVADRYRLVSPLGQGGMGSVWQAEHEGLRSAVAVKLLNPSIADNPDMLDRFMREAQSAAALRSTHVVQVFDYGVHAGMPFIAMELLAGESLGARLQRGVLPVSELAWIYTHVSRAIQKAHELGIVHRDLKPDNLFIVRDGDLDIAKVLDFGIAKVIDGTGLSQSSGNTRTGAVLGTPYYMSPEQARGNRDVDFRSDLWAMGIIAFEALTGALPFVSTALGDLVIKICTQPTPTASALAAVPSGFDDWFMKACHKEPLSRFGSMREQNEALQRVLGRSGAVVADVGAQLRRELGVAFSEFETLSSEPPPNTISVRTPRHTTNSTPIEVTAPRRPRSARPLVAAGVVTGATMLGWLTLRDKDVESNVEAPAGSAAALHTDLVAAPPAMDAPTLPLAQSAGPAPTLPSGAATTNVNEVQTQEAPAVKAASAAVASPQSGPATSLAPQRRDKRPPTGSGAFGAAAARPGVAAPEAAPPPPRLSAPAPATPVNHPSKPDLFDDRK